MIPGYNFEPKIYIEFIAMAGVEYPSGFHPYPYNDCIIRGISMNGEKIKFTWWNNSILPIKIKMVKEDIRAVFDINELK